MIRSWIALVALTLGLPIAHAAEELPAPNVRAADVPAPPKPQLPVLDLPLPDVGAPAKPVEGPKKADPLPANEPPKVVAPDTLLPESKPLESTPLRSAFPLPAPSVIVTENPNPSGTTPDGVTPSLPSAAALAPSNTPNNNVPNELKWRYKWHNGQWWYWSPDERWMIWDKNSWTVYDPATYQAPAGFAKPGPRVVTQQSMTAPLPERYSGAEVSVPDSYYIQPTPYAFGVDSYYGPYGPAASYYNRRSGVSIRLSTPAYVPVYESYLVPQYFGPRYTAPVGVYPGYGVPGYYGGRGVTIGFGF
jgi:hypothetical protein